MSSMPKISTCVNAPVDEDEVRLGSSQECDSAAFPGKDALSDQNESYPKILSLDVSEDLTEKNWAQMMDCTRAKFGHNRQAPNGRCRTYYRFTLSPSLDAACSLDSLRVYAKAWAEENFRSNGDLHEYAIACQYDAGALQASVIVNATNKETGRKLRVWRRGSVDLNMSARDMGREYGIGPVDLGVESFHDPVQKSLLAPASRRKRNPQGNERRPKADSSPRSTEVISVSMRASEAAAVDAAASAAGVTRSEYIRSRLRESQEDPQEHLFWVPDMVCALNSHVEVLSHFVNANSSIQKKLAQKIDALDESGEEDSSKLRVALRESELMEDQALEMMGECIEELGRIKSLFKGE